MLASLPAIIFQVAREAHPLFVSYVQGFDQNLLFVSTAYGDSGKALYRKRNGTKSSLARPPIARDRIRASRHHSDSQCRCCSCSWNCSSTTSSRSGRKSRGSSRVALVASTNSSSSSSTKLTAVAAARQQRQWQQQTAAAAAGGGGGV